MSDVFDYGAVVTILHDIYRFKSYSTRNGPGFEITYVARECSTNTNDIDEICGSVCRDYSSSRGLLKSPYHPVPYTDGAECIIKISQPNGTYIDITFIQFDVYNNNILEIRDGNSEESPLIGMFTGTVVPAYIKSTQNNIWIR